MRRGSQVGNRGIDRGGFIYSILSVYVFTLRPLQANFAEPRSSFSAFIPGPVSALVSRPITSDRGRTVRTLNRGNPSYGIKRALIRGKMDCGEDTENP